MHTITPCQRKITDRFPVASFVVNVPSSRLFEIVCATDPSLLRPEYRGRRNATNFFTSRSSGLLRAPAGHATYLIPADQLRRFAGKQRLYYALASYESPRGDDVKLSISANGPVPSVQLSSDFTGRTLDRSRIRGAVRDGKYGGPTPVLTWGGDTLVSKPVAAAAADYDDGFSPNLWTETTTTTTTARAAQRDDEPEPEIVCDEAGLGEAYGRPVRNAPSVITSAARPAPVSEPEPVGFEDAAALRSAGGHGRASVPTFSGVRGEPPGLEDMRGASSTYGGVVAEPPGIEHVDDVARYGAAAAVATTPPPALEPAGSEDIRDAVVAPMPASDVPGQGVAATWSDDDDEADLIAAPAADGEPLTIRRKFEILLPAAANESGDRRYTAVLGDVDGHGLHWGLVLFTQKSGALGKVLSACERRDPSQFRQTFGAAQADQLLQVTTAASPADRLAPVASARLWSPDWIEKFRLAGEIQAFQAAQNEIAIEHYFDRNLGFAAALGLTTDRALAMVFDRTIHMGIGGARRWILQAVSPITDDAARASALSALGHADLAAFQRAAQLEPTNRFGTQTHAALLAALRGLGAKAPFALPSVAEMLDRLVAAATGQPFELRVRGLRTSTTYTDAVQQVI
jgi:hypothetical protein